MIQLFQRKISPTHTVSYDFSKRRLKKLKLPFKITLLWILINKRMIHKSFFLRTNQNIASIINEIILFILGRTWFIQENLEYTRDTIINSKNNMDAIRNLFHPSVLRLKLQSALESVSFLWHFIIKIQSVLSNISLDFVQASPNLILCSYQYLKRYGEQEERVSVA